MPEPSHPYAHLQEIEMILPDSISEALAADDPAMPPEVFDRLSKVIADEAELRAATDVARNVSTPLDPNPPTRHDKAGLGIREFRPHRPRTPSSAS